MTTRTTTTTSTAGTAAATADLTAAATATTATATVDLAPTRRARALLSAVAPVLPAVATVLLLCLPTDREGIGGPARLTVADGASAVLVVYCAVALVRRRRRPLPPRAVAIIAAPAVAFAVATAASHDPAASLPGFVRHLQIFVLVPAAMVLLLRSRRDFRLVTGSVAVLAVVQGAIGVHQYATGTGALYRGQDIRAVGTFGPLNVMAMATVVAYGVIVALSLALSAPGAVPRAWRRAALICAVLLLVPLTLSFSRGAWIATALAGMAVLLLAGPRFAPLVLAVPLAAAAVLVSGAGAGSDQLGERLSSITQVTEAPDRSVTDRYALWAAAVSMWREDPLTGVGIKGFPAHRDGHASVGLSSSGHAAGAGLEFQREPLLSPHSMYLLLLGEQGLIGVTAVVGSWAALLVCGLRRLLRQRRAGRVADCGLAAIGLLLWQLTDFLYGDIGGPSTVLTAVVLGLAAWWALAPAAVGEPDEGGAGGR